MINKRLINTGVAAAAAFDPLQNFETVTYTGNGGTQKITGYIRKGAAFNGSSSGISINEYASTISGNDPFSISMWANVSSTGTNCLFEFGRYATTGVYRAFVNSSSQINFQFRNSSSITNITTTDTLSNNTWYNLIFTFNGSNAIIYIDGSQSQTGTASYNFDLAEGRIGFSFDGYNFNGKIDQVRIFNKALSSSEVTTLYGETYASSTKSTTDIFGDNSGVALYELDDSANDTGVAIDSGQSAVFNGSNSRIYTGSTFMNVQTFSVSAWVNFNTLSGTQTIAAAYEKDNQTSGDAGWIFRRIGSSGTLSFGHLVGSTWSNVAVSWTPNLNQWYHVSVTRNSDGSEIKFYVNGSQLGTTQSNTGSIAYTWNGGTSTFTIGGILYLNTFYDGFNGKIDDVRTYSDVLTSTEVGYIYNNNTASIPTDYVAYYKLDGNANDETTNYNGTATNVTYSTPALLQYNGTATNVNYLGMAFQPDLVWGKSRNDTIGHILFDSVRGENKQISTNTTSAEVTRASDAYLFNSNGFTVTTVGNLNNGNVNYVAWCFKGAGAAVSNTDGTITSQVSANQDAGFSIVKCQTSSSEQTVGHGLSSAPELIISKSLSNGTLNWNVWVSGFSDYQAMSLNTTGAKYTNSVARTVYSTSSTTMGLGQQFLSSSDYGVGTDIISYCFHSVDGYQKIGYWQGGTTTITLGFRPRFILFKDYSTGGDWNIWDSNRGNYKLEANTSDIEEASTFITPTDTGFTVPSESSVVYRLYLAIA